MRHFLIVLFLLMCSPLWAATYYVDCDAADDTGDGSQGNPKKYIQSGLSLMSGGDTLIICDGTYTGDSNMIVGANRPPDGSEGAYTTVQAETIGGVTIDGETVRNPLSMESVSADYITFHGLHFTRGAAASAANVRLGYCTHIRLMNCSSSYAAAGCHLFSSYSCSYNLYEDCWGWGHAQYAFHFRDSDHCIARRCVARIDYALSGDAYISSFFNYNSQYMEWQNCIVIDQDQGTYLDDGDNGAGGVFCMHLGNNGSENNIYVNYRGCMVLNCWSGNGGFLTSDHVENVTVNDFIVWGISNDNDNIYNRNADIETVYNHVVVGGNSTASGRGIYTSGVSENTVANSIVTGIAGYGLAYLSSASYVCLYDNDTNTTNVTSESNLITVTNPHTNSLLYLPRIESGSDLIGAGDGGTYVGAQITKRMGTSGTVWGESGYATLTSDDLWPWPNEDQIKSDFSTDSHETIVEARGFCTGTSMDGSPQTLTRYIWEYLGNEIPDSIYGVATSNGGSFSGVWR